MASPDSTDLLRVLAGMPVFDRDTDSKILQAANEVSGRAMFELFGRFDASAPNWANNFAEELMELSTGDPSVLVAFDDGRWQGRESDGGDISEAPTTAQEYFLRLEFTDSKACYYQFHLFPCFDEPFIQDVSRKRSDASQYVRICINHADDLQVFIQNLRGNPHLLEVHDSTSEEFIEAPSHAI